MRRGSPVHTHNGGGRTEGGGRAHESTRALTAGACGPEGRAVHTRYTRDAREMHTRCTQSARIRDELPTLRTPPRQSSCSRQSMKIARSFSCKPCAFLMPTQRTSFTSSPRPSETHEAAYMSISAPSASSAAFSTSGTVASHHHWNRMSSSSSAPAFSYMAFSACPRAKRERGRGRGRNEVALSRRSIAWDAGGQGHGRHGASDWGL